MKCYEAPDFQFIVIQEPDVIRTSVDNETPKIDLLGNLTVN